MKPRFCIVVFILVFAAACSARAQNPSRPGAGAPPPDAAEMGNGQTAPASQAGPTAGRLPEAPPVPEAYVPTTDADLEAQMQNALNKEPTLSGDTVRASVTANNIQISGSVGSAREKLTAARIAQSYAGNKKLVNHITITGRGSNLPQTDHSRESSRTERQTMTNAAGNPESGRGSRPPTRERPEVFQGNVGNGESRNWLRMEVPAALWQLPG